ncbi:Zn(2)-C6 fungal-type DNA-binding domain protein [Akanthomyces lecanii RCEF 1005]|uniref:Zn(2)-C6 fungal-type DNA-binding domain protein n=1 Tax=Akanthomyces lecanii RCEF 1005 TaxID=1081108 RepID=A0A167ZPP3_CORDF|nr:Zn(2)-C6 fungal-type DNA-binding domain protein [Akanthomyces lecanii RCEF 1005]
MDGLIQFGTTEDGFDSAPRRSRRSKGCLTCRKRKVKCDEARPICPGFASRKGSPSTGLHSSSAVAKPQETQAISTYAATSSAILSKSYISSGFSAFNLIPRSSIPPIVKLDGFRDGIVISHLLLKFQAIVEGNTPGSTDAPTFAGIFLAGDRQSTAYTSGLSVAEALFGRMHFDEALIQHSAVLYGRGLKRLQSDLQNMEKEEIGARSYMNLWSSTFLGIYEMMTASTPMSWLEHSRGLSALTESLGPNAFQGMSARRLFYSNRLFIATAAIATKRRTFLERHDWKVVPWAELEPLPKPVTILLQDIFCDIPGFMEDARRLTALSSSNHAEQKQDLRLLRNKIVNAYMETDVLRWSWEDEYPNVCWEVPVTPALKDAAGESNPLPFATVLHFSNFDRAIDAIYFNVIRLLLWELTDDVGLSPDTVLGATSGNKSGPFPNALLPPGRGNTDDFALEICRTVQYLVHGDTDSLGTLVLMFPLRVASHHLQNHPDVLQWLRWVLSKLTAKKGFKLGEYVMEITSAK